ncbi:MAG: hypothetical protein NT027_03455, partial [Proteobacteria bacterium]|nr:hypothetical protein [Pseudomonadota bacterium]
LEILTHESEQRAIMVSIHALLTLAKQDLRIATLEISKSFFRKIPAQDLAVLFESADDESRRALLEVVRNSTIAFLTSKNFIELRHIETASKAPLNLELLESLAHAIQSKANEVSSNSRSDTIFQTLMEYMPTSSLDHFPADELRRVALNVEQIFVDNIDIVIGLTNKMSIADTSDFLATLSDIGRQSILAKLPEIRAKRVAVRSLEPTENGLKIRSHLLTVLKGNSSKEENRNQLNAAS